MSQKLMLKADLDLIKESWTELARLAYLDDYIDKTLKQQCIPSPPLERVCLIERRCRFLKMRFSVVNMVGKSSVEKLK